MKIIILYSLVLILNLFVSGQLHAAKTSNVDFRSSLGIGPWLSNFEMSGQGHTAKVNSLLSPGFELSVGLRAEFIFVEYQLALFLPAYSARPKSQDAAYNTPMGLSGGLTFSKFPIEFFGGVERGSYRLSGGVNPAYNGLTLKGGINIIPGDPDVSKIGLKLEYRTMAIKEDTGGSLLPGLSSTAQIFYVAILLRN